MFNMNKTKIQKMLKYIISYLLPALAIIPTMKAQTLSIGPIAGVNYSKISNITNAEYQTGLAVGAFANYSINEKFGLGIKAMFSQLGTGYENSEGKTRLNYIQVPLTAVYYFGSVGNKIRPKVFLGPYAGFLLSAKDGDGNDIINANGTDVFKKLDVGVLGGLGINLIVSDRTWLNVDLGYATSMVNLTDNGLENYKNNALQLGVGLSFPVGN